MLAWILKTKPENLSCATGTSRFGVSAAAGGASASGRGAAPSVTDARGAGGTESWRKPSRRSWMPKLFTALPK